MAIWTAEDGSTINYETFNFTANKPTLLLLPGLLGSIGTQWRSFLPPLSAEFRLVLMDLRGHGRSTNNALELVPAQMLQDVVGLLDHLQVTAVHVAGYSLGGYLGLMLALEQKRRVATLLMHATKFYWTPEAVERMQSQLNPDVMADKVPTYANQLMQEHGARQWRTLVRQAATMVAFLGQNGLSESVVRGLQTKTLVSVGELDEMIALVEAQRLSRVLPNGELIVLPGVRHPFATLRLMPLLPMMAHFHKA